MLLTALKPSRILIRYPMQQLSYTSSIYRRNVSYTEFSQFLHDFHDEYATVGFRAKDPEHKGMV